MNEGLIKQAKANMVKVYKAGQENSSDAYDKGFAEGASDERTKTWGMIQNYGEKTYYNKAFYRTNVDHFYPVHDFHITDAEFMFRDTQGLTKEPFDLSARLEECGVEMEFSQCTVMTYVFMNSPFTRVPTIDTRSTKALNQICRGSKSLVIVDKVILKDDGSQTFGSPFLGCEALEEITFEGVIGQNGLSFADSPNLSLGSMFSIIYMNLADKSTDTSGTQWVVTFGATNLAKLPDYAIAAATQKGWTLA